MLDQNIMIIMLIAVILVNLIMNYSELRERVKTSEFSIEYLERKLMSLQTDMEYSRKEEDSKSDFRK